MRMILTALALFILPPAALHAEVVAGKAATKLIFAADKAEVRLIDGVDLP